MNKRTEIRDTFKTLIESDANFADVKVFSSYQAGLDQDEELPAITIFTPNESASANAMNRQRYTRKLELRFEVRISASESTDDELDELIGKLETLLADNAVITDLILQSELIATEIDVGFSGNQEIGLGTLIYECTYIS